MLVIKQEPPKLVMPAQAAVQNQQELSAAVKRSLEFSAYDVMAVDESQLQVCTPKALLPPLSPGSNSNPPETLGTPSQDVPNDRLSKEGVKPKDSTC